MGYILWFCRTSGTVSPSLFEPYNLNHVSVFPVTLRLSCLPLACVSLTYPSPTPPCCTVVGLSTYVIKSFLWFHSTVRRTNQKVFSPKFFLLLPPLVLVTHFSLSPTLFTFLTCFSQLASLPACFLCCLCCLWSYGWVGLKGTVCESVSRTHPSAPQHHTRTQAINFFPQRHF